MSGAIEGEGGAYVPCEELASPFPADPVGAIVGSSVGFVARDMEASSFPADPAGAIVGSGVGFVPKPCCVIAEIYGGYAGERFLRAPAVGEPTTVDGLTVAPPLLTLGADWTNYNSVTLGTEGDLERERRAYRSYIVPADTTLVRIVGTVTTYQMAGDTEPAGRPQTVMATYDFGPVHFDPDVAPDWDTIGTAYSGTIEMNDGGIPFVSDTPQIVLDVEFITADLGPAFGGGRLFQLALRNTSTEGIGRHSVLGFGDTIEVLPRFPDNPWGDTEDYSQIESGVLFDVEISGCS